MIRETASGHPEREEPPVGDGWRLVYRGFDPSEQKLRESLCTLGNGYLASRGALEEASADAVHYPGTYLAGGYNRIEAAVQDRLVENEDLVNWPNWLTLAVRPVGGDWLVPGPLETLEHQVELDLRRGVLIRRSRMRDRQGRETTLASRRLVHMGDPHLAAIESVITPENWSGPLEIRSGLDGRVRNAGVPRYSAFPGNHLEPLETARVGEEAVLLRVQTRQSQIQLVQAARTCAFEGEARAAVERRTVESAGCIEQRLTTEVTRSRPIRVEKVVATFSSRDRAISHCALSAARLAGEAGAFEELERSHAAVWARLWRRCDIELQDGGRTQLVLRLHVFHLLQTVSMHSIDLDVGLPARGLHGEAYRGHVFWDELFIFPFLNFRLPEITRALLLYRYRRLGEARRAAARAGYRGAMFPWQSGSDGREESQVVHLNPRSQHWLPDHTQLERHISAAIAYNVWHYYQVTKDRGFLSAHGAEMLLDIARFWASAATYDAGLDRFEIGPVIGPDEYHDAYPGAPEPGLRNNSYTNLMAVWTIWRAMEVLELLPDDRRSELRELLDLSDDELVRWQDVSRKMRLVFHRDGILSQFEGYEQLEEFPWEAYGVRYGSFLRLDRILEAEGDTPNRYKASKQADVLMLFYLFSAEELDQLFGRLGYHFDADLIQRTIDYYQRRSAHGSTLSGVVHAWVLARSDRPASWNIFTQALESDIADTQGGTTAEGIHLGAMAGTVDIVQRAYTGLETRDDVLWFNPRLPAPVKAMGLRLLYRGNWLRLQVTQTRLRVEFERGGGRLAWVGVQGAVHEFAPGDARDFELEP